MPFARTRKRCYTWRTMEPIGVIIVSFNTCALLRESLLSLRRCTLPLHTIVIDNGSMDGSVAMLRSEFAEVQVIEPGKNLGFAAANNLGMHRLFQQQTAQPAYVLLLNPDTVVHAGAIEILFAFLTAHPRVGVVGPRLLNPDGTLQPAAFRFPTLSMNALDLFPPGEVLPGRLYNSWWHGRYPQEPAGTAPFPIDHPLGACMLVRRAVIEQTGGFDEALFMYAEELEWCYRIRQAGWSIWQQPAARITHTGGASTSQFRTKMLIALWENRLKFFRKHYPTAFIRRHTLLVRIGMLRGEFRTWRDFAAGRISRDELRQRLWAFGKVMQLHTPQATANEPS